MGKHSNTVPETAQEQALARVGAEQWEHGKESRPLRKFVIDNVFQGGDESRRAQNVTNVGVRQAFSKTKPQAEVSMARGGARPGSGAFNLGESGLATDEAGTLAAAKGGTKIAGDNQRLQNLSNIVKMGEGQQADGIAGLTEVTRRANEQATQAAALSARERASRAALVGTLAGAGAGLYAGKAGAPPADFAGKAGAPPADFAPSGAGLDLANSGGLFRDTQDIHIAPQPLTGFGG